MKKVVFYFLFYIFLAPTNVIGEVVISEGAARITSAIDVNTFRKRALEQALNSITRNGKQQMTSFAIVENGQILIDQIHSTTTTEILAFKILSEEQKKNYYHVKIEAVIKGDKNDSAEVSCRETKIPAVGLHFTVMPINFYLPAWADLDTNLLEDELLNSKFIINLQADKFGSKKKKVTNLYSLYNPKDAKPNPKIFQIFVNIQLEPDQNDNLFLQQKILRMAVQTKLFRKNELLAETNENFKLKIETKYAFNINLGGSRPNWEKEKYEFNRVLSSHINQILSTLECRKVVAKLNKKNKNLFMNLGKIDGISIGDIFVLDTPEIEKYYLEAIRVDETTTNLKLISIYAGLF